MIRKKVEYTRQDFIYAYLDWSKQSPMIGESTVNPKRIEKWHIYCAIRDGLPLNHYIEKERIDQEKEKIFAH